MPLVMNALDKEVTVKVGGQHFTFKAGQIKEIYNEGIHHIMTKVKGEDGLVGLPQELTYVVHLKGDDVEKRIDPEHKAIIEAAKIEGREAHIKKLRAAVYNAQVSLAKDLAQAGYKHDARVEWSKGDLANLEELVKYQKGKEDVDQRHIDRIKELEKKLDLSK